MNVAILCSQTLRVLIQSESRSVLEITGTPAKKLATSKPPAPEKRLMDTIEIITEQGYKYKIVRANALDYGVSQKRKRLIREHAAFNLM